MDSSPKPSVYCCTWKRSNRRASNDPEANTDKYLGISPSLLYCKPTISGQGGCRPPMPRIPWAMGKSHKARYSPASSVLMVSSLLGSLRPILLKEYMRMLYTDAGCKSTMLAWLMVGEMLRVDCLKSQESGERAPISNHSQKTPQPLPSLNSQLSLWDTEEVQLYIDSSKKAQALTTSQRVQGFCSIKIRDQGRPENVSSKCTGSPLPWASL